MMFRNIQLVVLFTSVFMCSSAWSQQYIYQQEGENKCGVFGNASKSDSDDKKRKSICIKFGSVNQDKSGAFQIYGNDLSVVDNDKNAISIIMKGDGGTGKFVLIVIDSDGGVWTYGGIRWKDPAQISCINDQWHKKVFYFKDFVYTGKNKATGGINPKKIKTVQLAIGANLKNPDEQTTMFFLHSISYEKDPKPETFMDDGKEGEISGSDKKKLNEFAGDERKIISVDNINYHLPKWINWGKDNLYVEKNASREYLYLNNYWQFYPNLNGNIKDVIANNGKYPALPQSVEYKNDDWFYAKVPGCWDNIGKIILNNSGQKSVASIKGKRPSEYVQGWLRRTVEIPEHWNGKKVLIEFASINESGRVFVNRCYAGDISRTGSIDISSYIRHGNKNEIAVFVQYLSCPVSRGNGDFEYLKNTSMGGKWWFSRFSGPGIDGDVILKALPTSVVMDDLHIITSVSDNNAITGKIDIQNLTSVEQKVTLRASVFDNNKEVFSMQPKQVILKPNQIQKTILCGNWSDPVYWSPDNPKNYKIVMRLYDRNGELIDQISDQFGFRELSVKGGDFYLNKNKIRIIFCSNGLHPDRFSSEEIRRMIKFLKGLHYNGLILHKTLDERVIKICNEMGMLVIMRGMLPGLVRNGKYLPGVTNRGYPYEIFLSDKFIDAKNDFIKTVKGIIRRFRNDPSIVIWAINPLLLADGEWINPNLLTKERPLTEVAQAAFKQEDFMRLYDPGRLVTHSMGSTYGVAVSVNPYPTFSVIPDEWTDWPMKWSFNKWKPLFLEEVGLPYDMNFGTWFNNDTNSRVSQWKNYHQCFYEHSARYFGDKSYNGCKVNINDNGFRNLQELAFINEKGFKESVMNRSALATYAYWLKRCHRSWRTYDVSAIGTYEDLKMLFDNSVKENILIKTPGNVITPGIKFDKSNINDFSHVNVVYNAMKDIFQPFIVYIGGRKERFSSQEHLYYIGDTVNKQFIYINDTFSDITASGVLQITRDSDKKVMLDKQISIEVKAGKNVFAPFAWNPPHADDIVSYTIKIAVKAGTYESNDRLTIRVYPKSSEQITETEFYLYDEKGKTENLLKKAGVHYKLVSDFSMFNDTAKLIIGEDSFTDKFLHLANIGKLPTHIENGMSVLVMSQSSQTALKNYVEERRSRFVFIKDKFHPVLKDLSNDQLHHWRGQSNVLAPYPDTTKCTDANGNRFMRWGTEGIVSSYVMDKPYSGRFRILLDCDFDLSRTPLMEYLVGKGSIVFCMLDVTSRFGIDPASTTVVRSLIKYLDTYKPKNPAIAAYIGGDKTEQLISNLGFVTKHITSDELGKFTFTIIGEKSSIDPNIVKEYIKAGNQVLLLNIDNGVLKKIFPNLSINKEMVRLAKSSVSDVAVGNSDLYFNPAVKINTLGDGKIFHKIKLGKGVCYVMMINPDAFSQNLSKLKAKRLISTVLTDLNVAAISTLHFVNKTNAMNFTGDTVLFKIDPDVKGASDKWYFPDFKDNEWGKIQLSQTWEAQGYTENRKSETVAAPYDGDAWYRIKFVVPVEMKGKQLYFKADRIDDLDWCYFNGKMIGHTGTDTEKYWATPRIYPIPFDLIKYDEENVIAVRVSDLRGEGGILGSVSVGGAEEERPVDIIYPNGSRLFYSFDPNMWRQW